MQLRIGQLCSSINEAFPSCWLVYLGQDIGSRWSKPKACKTDVIVIISAQFDSNFSIFQLGPAAAYRSCQNSLWKFHYSGQALTSSRGKNSNMEEKQGQSQIISHKTNLDHNKCIKIQIKLYLYWISVYLG